MQYLLLLNEFQTHKLQWPKWPGWFSFQRPSHAWTSSPNCYICPNPNLLHGSEIRIYCRNLKSNSEILASSGLLLDSAAAELSDLFLWSGYALSLYLIHPVPLHLVVIRVLAHTLQFVPLDFMLWHTLQLRFQPCDAFQVMFQGVGKSLMNFNLKYLGA